MKDIISIIKSSNLDAWFTHYLWTERGGRFIVWITNNVINTFSKSSETLLKSQLKWLAKLKNLTIGWWKDNETNNLYIDFWIAVDDISEAKILGKSFSQIAIWDMKEMKEIRL